MVEVKREYAVIVIKIEVEAVYETVIVFPDKKQADQYVKIAWRIVQISGWPVQIARWANS